MKHRLKQWLRRSLAVLLHLTGLRALFRRGRRGVPVLMFHNVGNQPGTDYLPGHMKISERKLSRLLALLKRGGYGTATVSQVVAEFEQGRCPDGVVALTFDDGYRDNHDVLLPLLQRHGATATVYVQTGPMKGRLNWLHHYFWAIHAIGPHETARRLAEELDSPHLKSELSDLAPDAEAAEYQLKRLLKYDISAEDRDRCLAAIFAAIGGDDAELARRVYLGPEECRALDAAGVELGAHTVNHLVLASLEPAAQRREIEGSLRDLQSWLGHDVASFAYPYGRSWDYDRHTLQILQELGFGSSVTAMPGLNTEATPRLELCRTAVNQDSSLAEVLCEVDGVFDWLDRRGLPLRG